MADDVLEAFEFEEKAGELEQGESFEQFEDFEDVRENNEEKGKNLTDENFALKARVYEQEQEVFIEFEFYFFSFFSFLIYVLIDLCLIDEFI